MERVTIRLDESIEQWARQKAAEQRISLSSFVEALLKDRMKGDANIRRPKVDSNR